MTIEEIMLQSEALIFSADRPITANDIEQILKDSMSEEEEI
jgi:chromosome segregation and condensation protein ScpB